MKTIPLRLTARMSFVFKICSRCKGRSRLHDRIDVSVVRGGSCQYTDTRELFPRRSTMITNFYAKLRRKTITVCTLDWLIGIY
jgi:hypothetical protein